jgi:uridylate kinase
MAKSKPVYKRILLKLSGEALGADNGVGIDREHIAAHCREIIELRRMGVEVGVVAGGGNIIRGSVAAGKGLKRATADYMGMLSTVINGMAMKDIFESLGQPTRVMSAINISQVCEPYIRLRALRHMEKGRVVILSGGTGNPFFTTETTAALRGIELEADILMKATKVDGVYDKDPKKNSDAVKFDHLTYIQVLEKNLKIMDSTAISMCMEYRMPILVFNMNVEGNMKRAVMGLPIGTKVASE